MGEEDLAKAQVAYGDGARIWFIRHSGKKISGVTLGSGQNYKALAERIARLTWLRWDEGTLTKDELSEYRVSLIKMISGVPKRGKMPEQEQAMDSERKEEAKTRSANWREAKKRELETQASMRDLEGGKPLVESEPQQEEPASEPPPTEQGEEDPAERAKRNRVQAAANAREKKKVRLLLAQESEPQQEGSALEPSPTEPVKKARKKAEPKKETSAEDVEKPGKKKKDPNAEAVDQAAEKPRKKENKPDVDADPNAEAAPNAEAVDQVGEKPRKKNKKNERGGGCREARREERKRR